MVDDDPGDQPAPRRSREGDFHVTVEKDFLARRRRTPWASTKLQVVETGGDTYQQEREQWDDGNNVVALEPGVVVAYERNTYTIAKMREAGVEVIAIEGFELGQGPRRRALHDLPAASATRSRRPSDGHSDEAALACVVAVAGRARDRRLIASREATTTTARRRHRVRSAARCGR